jgi:hypothetical protein
MIKNENCDNVNTTLAPYPLKRVGGVVYRPRTLAEVSGLGLKHGDTDRFLREFMDSFYIEQDGKTRAWMLQAEPPLEDNPRHNAYYAAVAEHLALRYSLPIPEWTNRPARFLHAPWYPCGLESLKAYLLVRSPTAFRRRMIFVDADPLYRPRRDKPFF